MAIEHLRRINSDERLRIMLEDRERAERDRLWILKDAELTGMEMGMEKGIEKGLEIGIEKGIVKGLAAGQAKILSALVQSGMPLEEVASRLEIPLEEVQSLLKTKD